MYYTYILRSLKDGRYYYGHTQNLENRLEEHNSGNVKATRPRRPLVIHYKEEYNSRSEAAKREYFFKSIPGYIYLKERGIT
jgi:putative endonuclease